MSNNGSILIDGKEQIVEVIRMVRAPDGTKGIEALDDPTGMNHSAHVLLFVTDAKHCASCDTGAAHSDAHCEPNQSSNR